MGMGALEQHAFARDPSFGFRGLGVFDARFRGLGFRGFGVFGLRCRVQGLRVE